MNGNRRTLHCIRGPITLVTLGVLFALNNFTPYRFSETWPVLLIVFGALSLLGRSSGANPPQPPPYGYPPPPPRPGDPGTQPGSGEQR
jgi:cell wall-active antibiotic response 4TMS protein YvqF